MHSSLFIAIVTNNKLSLAQSKLREVQFSWELIQIWFRFFNDMYLKLIFPSLPNFITLASMEIELGKTWPQHGQNEDLLCSII